ncbi:ABC transporter ATP-binding protein [Rothia mucilaginosa]|uniref:ABC transporter ATP-binding protein n=1 Tax=Rothia mucilaginosa TaxID=43675 RepID=UPI0028E1B1FA|nr:ABC transporter ATP-binding protein [Rothia mucilaginosa]
MKSIYTKLRLLFPGRSFTLLIINLIGLFLLSLMEMIGVAAILPIVNIAMGAEITGYLAVISDIFGNPQRSDLVLYLGIVLVLAFVIKGIAALLFKRWSLKFTGYQQLATSTTILNHYMKDSYFNHKKSQPEETAYMISTYVVFAYRGFVGSIINFVGDFLSIIVLLIMILCVMPVPALIAFAYFGITIAVMQFFLRRGNAKYGEITARAGRDALRFLLDDIRGFREIRITNAHKAAIEQYREPAVRSVKSDVNLSFLNDFPKYSLEVIFIVGIAGLLALVTATQGADGLPSLMLFATACIRILPNATRMIASLGGIRANEFASEEVAKVIRSMSPEEQRLQMVEFKDEIDPATIINSGIEPVDVQIDNLVYRYPDGDKDVLKDIQLDVPAGTSVAFVGGSGSGKTTLVDLILGLLTPTSGTISSQGKDIHTDLHSWYQKIGYVPQDPYLGNGTLREAVAFGIPAKHIDDDRVIYCLELAELMPVVETLEDGINTSIGENGNRLSGGQRQRVGIARAMYRNPSLLVMDEATSALDNETEHKITQTINRISKEITVIIVAHRLSTVRNVDQLVYLSQGRIANKGTFKEVQAANEEFANLVRLGQLPD